MNADVALHRIQKWANVLTNIYLTILYRTNCQQNFIKIKTSQTSTCSSQTEGAPLSKSSASFTESITSDKNVECDVSSRCEGSDKNMDPSKRPSSVKTDECRWRIHKKDDAFTRKISDKKGDPYVSPCCQSTNIRPTRSGFCAVRER